MLAPIERNVALGHMKSREVRAIQVAIACALLGASTKLVIGFMSGSMSMLSSAADSIGDLFVSFVNLYVVNVAAREADDDHNFGHAKIEGLGAIFEGGFILAAGAFIIYEATRKIIAGSPTVSGHDSALGIIVMLPILAMTIGTVLYLRKVAKETGSLVLKADAAHYTADVYVGVGVLVALVLVKLTGIAVIDPIISILIALSMFRASWQIVRAGLGIVMDESLDVETVKKIRAVLDGAPRIKSFHDLRTRVGRSPLVDFHVIVPPEMTAQEVHDIFLELRKRIRAFIGPTTRVIMHADPASSVLASSEGS